MCFLASTSEFLKKKKILNLREDSSILFFRTAYAFCYQMIAEFDLIWSARCFQNINLKDQEGLHFTTACKDFME